MIVSVWKAAFKADLEGLVALEGVTIYDAGEGLDDVDRDHVILGNWSFTRKHRSFGANGEDRMEEVFVVECRLLTRKITAAEARDRAIAIYNAVEQQVALDPKASDTVWNSETRGGDVIEGIWDDEGRTCTVEFTIEVEVHT